MRLARRPANAAALVARADLVLDCADSFAASYVLSRRLPRPGRPLVSASALGLSGYVGGFCGGGPRCAPSSRTCPTRRDSCATAGVLGPAVAVLGALQAQMALRSSSGSPPSPLGRLVSVDLRTLCFGGFAFQKAPEPPEPTIPFVPCDALEASDLVIDLRGPDEAPECVTVDALRLSPAGLAADPDAIPTDRRVVLCCATGIRAHRAARLLAGRGVRNLAVLALSLG